MSAKSYNECQFFGATAALGLTGQALIDADFRCFDR